jgi:hypothetical protein
MGLRSKANDLLQAAARAAAANATAAGESPAPPPRPPSPGIGGSRAAGGVPHLPLLDAGLRVAQGAKFVNNLRHGRPVSAVWDAASDQRHRHRAMDNFGAINAAAQDYHRYEQQAAAGAPSFLGTPASGPGQAGASAQPSHLDAIAQAAQGFAAYEARSAPQPAYPSTPAGPAFSPTPHGAPGQAPASAQPSHLDAIAAAARDFAAYEARSAPQPAYPGMPAAPAFSAAPHGGPGQAVAPAQPSHLDAIAQAAQDFAAFEARSASQQPATSHLDAIAAASQQYQDYLDKAAAASASASANPAVPTETDPLADQAVALANAHIAKLVKAEIAAMPALSAHPEIAAEVAKNITQRFTADGTWQKVCAEAYESLAAAAKPDPSAPAQP